MACFEGLITDPVFWSVSAVSAIAAFVMLWMVRFQRFQGKLFYALTFMAMIWTLMTVGSETASATFSCQFQWAIWAWLGNALVPVAWCFFVFAYVENAPWLKRRWVKAVLVIVPLGVFLFAATNPWHHLVYTQETAIPPGEDHIDYVHGTGFYGIIVTLYVFVMAALICLLKAFRRAQSAAWPLLTMLIIITLTPLTANAAYVVLGFTVFGLDPTAFMFTLGILAFTGLLVTNTTMDMASVGRSILFDTMSEAVILIDSSKNIVLMNTTAERSVLLKHPHLLQEAIHSAIEGLDPPDDLAQVSIGERVYEPRIQEVANPLDPSGVALGWSVTFVDITDRIATSWALKEALARADDASRAKDEFISIVSHELRTPLTSLKGGLTLTLSGRVGNISDSARAPLLIAQRNSLRLSRLVDNILLAQKININALSLDQKPVDLSTVLKEAFDENKGFALERGVKLAAKETMQPAVVLGDAFAIRQIVDNMLSNAIKFSKQNDVIEGALTVAQGLIKLSIKDQGLGIADGMESKVFGRFEQVKNNVQSSTQGSGLGLHISKQLANQMAGDLYYESQVDVGTTFHLEFQTAAAQEGEPTKLAS